MKILAIETSCDDTGIAIIEVKNRKIKVLTNLLSSQVKLHRKYGGVYPTLAKREHQKNLPKLLKKALAEAKIKNPGKELDLIAVTVGPGLEPCLWVGVNFAQELAERHNLPLLPVNHLEGHLLVNLYQTNLLSKKEGQLRKIKLPALALVVSGGHTQLILMKGINQYKLIGETRDDAAGECFDKTARILGLGYPGGPAIAQLAKNKPSKIKLPRPMLHSQDYDFSFSGLKTAVLYKVKDKKLKKDDLVALASEIQQAIIDVLIKKTLKGAQDFKVKTIIIGGGVSANQELRQQLKNHKEVKAKFDLLIPEKNLATDNALMIAIAAYYHAKEKNWKKIKVNANLKV